MTAPSPARASAPRSGRLRSGLRFQPVLRGGRARGGWVVGGRGPRSRMEGPAVDATLPCRRCKIKPVGCLAWHRPRSRRLRRKPAWPRSHGRTGGSRSRVVDTALGAPHNPALLTGTRVREDATFDGGGVSRVAKGADCKSAGLRLRRFESYLPHHPKYHLNQTIKAA